YADGDYVLFNYDNKGVLQSRSTARGVSIFYEYTYGRLTRVKLPSGYDPDGMLGTDYTYDLYSRITRIQRSSYQGSLQYTYDANSRVTAVIQSWGGNSGNINYQYDALGRRTKMTLNTGQVVNYSYDPLNRLTGVDVNGNVYAFAYAGASPLVQSLTRPNGGATAYQYDALNRLTGLTNRDTAANIISQHLYTYNQQDLRAGETVVQPDLPAPLADESVSYNYNRLNQLTSARGLDVKTFTCDRDGNQVGGYTPEGYEFAAAYDPFNRLQSLTYTDAAGAVHTTKYYYLGSKLDLVRKYLNGTLDQEHRYLYDGPLRVQERNTLNKVVNEFTWGLHTGGGIGRLLDLNQGGTHYSYLYDGKGNVTGLVDSADMVATTYQYDPFGAPLAAPGSPSQPMQFSTKPYDPETGLSYYGFRFYSPHMARWLTRDPIGEYGGINLYEFIGNNPVNFADPLGLWMVGITGSQSVEVGHTFYDPPYAYGIGETGSANIGFSFGKGRELGLESFRSFGWFAGGPYDHGYPNPKAGKLGNFVYGAFAGFGGGFFLSNANCATELESPSDTWTLNFMALSLQFSLGNKWVFSATIGDPGGLSFSRYQTMTKDTGRW
ncbi:MAG: hypothetical protein KKD99_07695, partial [Proteobacteria bacterium]|nr:hypothetical protein [Pseudomonadota bacterium]